MKSIIISLDEIEKKILFCYQTQRDFSIICEIHQFSFWTKLYPVCTHEDIKPKGTKQMKSFIKQNNRFITHLGHFIMAKNIRLICTKLKISKQNKKYPTRTWCILLDFLHWSLTIHKERNLVSAKIEF